MSMGMSTRLTLFTSAAMALGRRYILCWRQAWVDRADMGRSSMRLDEAEFLTSALALQHTPTSPAPRRDLAANDFLTADTAVGLLRKAGYRGQRTGQGDRQR